LSEKAKQHLLRTSALLTEHTALVQLSPVV